MQRRVVMLVDDVDGGSATETVGFELDGTAYEIDLSAENADHLRRRLGRWTASARQGSRQAAERSAPQVAAKLYDPKAVRAFARARGMRVSDRGRPSKRVLEQFFAAGN